MPEAIVIEVNLIADRDEDVERLLNLGDKALHADPPQIAAAGYVLGQMAKLVCDARTQRDIAIHGPLVATMVDGGVLVFDFNPPGSDHAV